MLKYDLLEFQSWSKCPPTCVGQGVAPNSNLPGASLNLLTHISENQISEYPNAGPGTKRHTSSTPERHPNRLDSHLCAQTSPVSAQLFYAQRVKFSYQKKTVPAPTLSHRTPPTATGTRGTHQQKSISHPKTATEPLNFLQLLNQLRRQHR